jgi:hypothetical protein
VYYLTIKPFEFASLHAARARADHARWVAARAGDLTVIITIVMNACGMPRASQVLLTTSLLAMIARTQTDAAQRADMPPRLALLLLLAGHTSAQLSCVTQEDLLANMRWVRVACEEEGEAFADADTLVPSTVTTAGCAEVVHRVVESCDGLLSRSLWFKPRRSALMTAVESASAAGLLGQADALLGNSGAQEAAVFIADPDAPVIRHCPAVLEDGFEQIPHPPTGQSRVEIDVRASCGQLRLAFDDLTLDSKANDNLRLYADAELTDELRPPIFHSDLPLAGPIPIRGSVVHILLISDGASRRTSLRATVECVESPCQHGGTCTSYAAPGVSGAGHRRTQATAKCTAAQLQDGAAVIQAQCCGAGEDCSNGAPNSCDAGCAAVLPSFVRDCSATLAGTDGGDAIVTQLQSAVALCSEPTYQCTCTTEYNGDNCEEPNPIPDPEPEPQLPCCTTFVVDSCAICPHNNGLPSIGCFDADEWQPWTQWCGTCGKCCFAYDCSDTTAGGSPSCVVDYCNGHRTGWSAGLCNVAC